MTEGANGVVAGRVLKRDARGRVHSTAEHREAVLAEFERSGLSGPHFAQMAGIPYQTFSSWRKRQRKPLEPDGDPSVASRRRVGPVALRFAEAVVTHPSTDAATCAPVLVRLAGGACLEITGAAQVPLAVQLIQALARSC